MKAPRKPRPKSSRPVGRPPKELSDLPKGWEKIVLTRMKKGASRDEVRGLMMISNDLFARFMKDEPKFSETILLGEGFSRQWWEEMGRKNLKSRVFRDRLWGMNMANRFGTGHLTVNLNSRPDLSKLEGPDLEVLAALVAKSSDVAGD